VDPEGNGAALGRKLDRIQIIEVTGDGRSLFGSTVHPQELHAAGPAAAVDEQASVGSRNVHVPRDWVVDDAPDQGLRLAAQCSAGRIEGLREQLLVAGEQEISVGINGVRLALKQRLVYAAVERCVVNRVVCRFGGVVVDGQIEKVL